MNKSQAQANLEKAKKEVKSAEKELAKVEAEERRRQENLHFTLVTKPQLILGLILFVALVLAWIGR